MTKSHPPSVHAVPDRVVDRIFDRVDVQDWLDCWPWLLSTGSHGYGQVGWGLPGGRSATTTAHRVAWVALNGSIPEEMTVDHECRNIICCNPLHLRLRTNVDNASDNGNARKTHCLRGHPLSGPNLYLHPNGKRLCRACRVVREGS